MGWRQPDPSAEGSYADRPLEVAAPLEVGGHLRSSQLVQGDAVAPGRPKRTTRPLGDLQTLLPFPATGRQRNQGGAKVGHPIHQDRPVPLDMVGQQHQRRTLGELDRGDPSPIASTANTTRPPKTSLKYPRSPATSLLGVYTKSSCWRVWAGQSRPQGQVSASQRGHAAPLDEEQRRGWIKQHTL